MSAFRDAYGAGPLHALAVLASLAIVAYALLEVAERSGAISFAIFFGAAIVAHDMVAFPLYSALGLVAGRAALAGGEPGRMALNHLRVPAILSALAFVVWFPIILGITDDSFVRKAGFETGPYLGRWLGLTAALFAGSALVYAVRLRRATR